MAYNIKKDKYYPQDKTAIKKEIAEAMKEFKGKITQLPPSGVSKSGQGVCKPFGGMRRLF